MARFRRLRDIPSGPKLMIAGFDGEDPGSVSSALPKYLFKKLRPRRLGKIEGYDEFYLFDRDLVTPVIEYKDGREINYHTGPENTFHYAKVDDSGIVIFLGDTPYMQPHKYANILISAAQSIGVERLVIVGGINSEVPPNKERMIYGASDVNKEVFDEYGIKPLNHHSLGEIGYLVQHHSRKKGLDTLMLRAAVPHLTNPDDPHRKYTINPDNRSVYDLLRKISRVSGIKFDLAELEDTSAEGIEGLMRLLEEHAANSMAMRSYLKGLDEQYEESVHRTVPSISEEDAMDLERITRGLE